MRHEPGAFDASTFSSRARSCGACTEQVGEEAAPAKEKEDKKKKTKKVKKKINTKKKKKKKKKKFEVASETKANGGGEDVPASGLEQLALAITDAFRGAKEMYETKTEAIGAGAGGAGGEFVGVDMHGSPVPKSAAMGGGGGGGGVGGGPGAGAGGGGGGRGPFVADNEASPFRIRSPYNYSFYRPSNPVGVMSPERFRATTHSRRPPTSMLDGDAGGRFDHEGEGRKRERERERKREREYRSRLVSSL